MKAYTHILKTAATAVIVVAVAGMSQGLAQAHCDTLDGPVVKDAQKALAEGKVTRVLKWVKPKDESAIKAAFNKTMVERKKGGKARQASDQRFFETVVKVHRAGEGAPFTGIKPAGTDLGPAVTGADKALETGSVDDLVRLITKEVEMGIRERFAHAKEARKTSETTVKAGQEYVAHYVEYVHYVERLHDAATGDAAGHEHE